MQLVIEFVILMSVFPKMAPAGAESTSEKYGF